MIPRFETLPLTYLIGMRRAMTYAENTTYELWRNFVPRKKEISELLNTDFISLQVYPSEFNFSAFNPHISFEKWAAVEVPEHCPVPEGMESLVIPAGRYAVFSYKGPASEGPQVFAYIFGTWLPQSGCELDNRPHFERLGPKYHNQSTDSEEEIWIPVR